MPTLVGEVATAAVGAGHAQRHGAVRRVQIRNLGDGHAVVFEDLRTLELNAWQAQLSRQKAQPQACVDGVQLRALSGFVAGQVFQGLRHVHRHVVRHQPSPAGFVLACLPAKEQPVREHAAQHQAGCRREEPAPIYRRPGRRGQGVEHRLQAVHGRLLRQFVVGGLERQAAAGQPLKAQVEHRVFGDDCVDAAALIAIELVVEVGHQLLVRRHRVIVHRRSPVEGFDTACKGGYSASFARAAARRLMTVPMGTSRTSATSR
ncbi:hypothetical protein D3C84_656850 [compost metagenome]